MAHTKQTFEHPDLGRIRICSCGKVHLTIGRTTLHLQREDLDALGELIDMATKEQQAPRVVPRVVGEA